MTKLSGSHPEHLGIKKFHDQIYPFTNIFFFLLLFDWFWLNLIEFYWIWLKSTEVDWILGTNSQKYHNLLIHSELCDRLISITKWAGIEISLQVATFLLQFEGHVAILLLFTNVYRWLKREVLGASPMGLAPRQVWGELQGFLMSSYFTHAQLQENVDLRRRIIWFILLPWLKTCTCYWPI